MLGLCTLWAMRMHTQNGVSMLTACTHCMRAACTLPRCPRLLQLREAEDASATAAAKAEELSAALAASEEALSEARSLTAQQASRLSHLESEFEALQVRRSGRVCVRMSQSHSLHAHIHRPLLARTQRPAWEQMGSGRQRRRWLK